MQILYIDKNRFYKIELTFSLSLSYTAYTYKVLSCQSTHNESTVVMEKSMAQQKQKKIPKTSGPAQGKECLRKDSMQYLRGPKDGGPTMAQRAARQKRSADQAEAEAEAKRWNPFARKRS